MNDHAILQLQPPGRRGDAHAASLKYLWGIVIRGAEDDARGHYSSPIRSDAAKPKRRRHPRLRDTLEAVRRLIPAERLVGVLVRGETTDVTAELRALGANALVQPAWRGSAAELFLAALAIARDDPDATVAVLPWEHLVGYEGMFMSYVARAASAVQVRPDLAVMIGAPAHRTARARDWIVPGGPVDGLEGSSIRTVARFVRQPSRVEISALLDAGALVATRVIVAKVSALITLGHSCLPDVLETLEPLQEASPGPEKDLLCDAVYECMPRADITSALPPRGDGFAVLPFPEFLELEDRSTLALAS